MVNATAPLFAALCAIATVCAQDGQTLVVEGARLFVTPTRAIEGPEARLAIRDGKIAAVGREVTPQLLARARRVRLEGATLVPGFVDLHDHLDLGGDLAETIDAFTPDLRAADAFDPFDDELERRALSGITSTVLAPLSKNTFAGIAALVKFDGDVGVVATPESYLKIVLVAESLDQQRFPTSRMGAADLIRGAYDDARNPLGPQTSDLRVLRETLDGSRGVAVHADTLAEMTLAMQLFSELEIRPVVLGAAASRECIELLRGSAASVALNALTEASKTEQLEQPARLAAAGIRFSFLGRSGDELRRSAALAVRHGLDRSTALAALTRVPADQAGVSDRVGTLLLGRDADLIAFDGHPIDLTSRRLAVWVGGRRIDDEPEDGSSER